MDQSVYLVTAGEYSDYRIQAAYTNEAAAKAHAAAHNANRNEYDRADVEEWDLHAVAPVFKPNYRVTDGGDDVSTIGMEPTWPGEEESVERYREGLIAVSTDLERALKVARDYAAHKAAEAAGL